MGYQDLNPQGGGVTVPVPVVDGGTGADNVPDAQTNLGIISSVISESRYEAVGGQVHHFKVGGVETYVAGIVDVLDTFDETFWTVTYLEPGAHPNQSVSLVPGTPNKLVLVDNATAANAGITIVTPWFIGMPCLIDVVAFLNLAVSANWTYIGFAVEDALGNTINVQRTFGTDYRTYLTSNFFASQWEGARPAGEWIGLTTNLTNASSADGGQCSMSMDNVNPDSYAQLAPGSGNWAWIGRRRQGLSNVEQLRDTFRINFFFGKTHSNPSTAEISFSPNGLCWFR